MRVYQKNALTVSIAVNATDCPLCGVVFGLTDEFEEARREDGRGFYCPNGHSIIFTSSLAERERKARDEAEKARREAAQFRAMLDVAERQRNQARDELAVERKAAAAAKRKAVGGVCPHPGCKRHFVNLERHMKTKHAGGRDDRPTTPAGDAGDRDGRGHRPR